MRWAVIYVLSLRVVMSEEQQIALIACNESEDRARLREGLANDPAPRYVIIEAESGVRAIELCRERSPDYLIRAILDHSTALIFIKDLESRYLWINHRYEVLFGVTESEVIGKTDYDIHAREIADALRANNQEVITANRPLQFEEQVVTAEGARHFIVVKFPLYDEGGRPYGVCGI